MKNLSKLLAMLLAVIMVLGAVAASAETLYERGDDDEIYEEVFGEYNELMAKAKAAATDDERFVLEAQAEAMLLNTAAFVPFTTQGGTYQITRIAYRTVPFAKWGNDDDRWYGLIISDEFVTKEERAELIEAWNAAAAGGEAYDPAAILTAKGHTINPEYKTTFSTAPVTLDWLNTSSQSDTEVLVQCVDGLVEYDNMGVMQPALAESWEISEDGLTYTFKIREGANWYTSEGTEYAPVTAYDFVAGFHHMLDTAAGLEYLVTGEQDGPDEVVKGTNDYVNHGGSFDDVGYVAADANTLVITLSNPYSYFMTMLTYSIFQPICESFYTANGGVYGIDEYQAAFADTNTYTFGKNTDVSSQVYCGPFLLTKLVADSEMVVVKNENYYNPDKVKLNSITWIYDMGENPKQYYADAVSGVYAAAGLGSATGVLDLAKADGNFDKYAYVVDTTSTTYFGGLNLNRGTFALASGAVASSKTEQQKIDWNTAVHNINFRKAIVHGLDRSTYNAVSAGEDLKYNSLRNMYTHPEFVKLSAEFTDENGKTFPAGTMYGDMVQYYLNELGETINVADGVEGWYDQEAAQAYLAAAKEELGDSVTWPIVMDIVYYSPSAAITARCQAVKKSLEDNLGAENIQVNLIEATTSADYYAVGYRALTGAECGMDFFFGSGWGPDYGDPVTYLGTMTYGGYMLKVLGI